jgi:hypothetical protein
MTPTVRPRGILVATASDGGAGVDPRSVFAQLDSRPLQRASFRRGRIAVAIGALSPGRHRITLQVSDYQEAKNMENALRILPNTRVLTAESTVR